MNVNLSLRPEVVTGPTSHFVYVENVGALAEVARRSWNELHSLRDELELDRISRMMGLSRIDPGHPSAAVGVYQAGYEYVSAPSRPLPSGMKMRILEDGRYAKFILRGSYSQLPYAYPLAIKRVAESGLKLRQAFYIETYINTPMTAREEDLITEIYVPVE